MSERKPSLSVVIPMFNEIENVSPMIARVHEGLANYDGRWELLVVDDGSTDGTPQALNKESRIWSVCPLDESDTVRVIEVEIGVW